MIFGNNSLLMLRLRNRCLLICFFPFIIGIGCSKEKSFPSYLQMLETQMESCSDSIPITFENKEDSILIRNHSEYTFDQIVSGLQLEYRKKIMLILILFTIVICAGIIIIIIRYKQKVSRQKEQKREIAKKEQVIASLQQEISRTRLQAINLQDKVKSLQYLKDEVIRKEIDLAALQNVISELRLNFLKEKPLYKRIQKLTLQSLDEDIKLLSQTDRAELEKIVGMLYANFMKELRKVCPSLTDNDLYFCCLVNMGFSLQAISICTGFMDTTAARQRKSRIKKKLTMETGNPSIFYLLFKDN